VRGGHQRWTTQDRGDSGGDSNTARNGNCQRQTWHCESVTAAQLITAINRCTCKPVADQQIIEAWHNNKYIKQFQNSELSKKINEESDNIPNHEFTIPRIHLPQICLDLWKIGSSASTQRWHHDGYASKGCTRVTATKKSKFNSKFTTKND
jgi:hypothetical protein